MSEIKNKLPKVIIVLLTHNQLENTVECIKSLLEINYQNIEIIVVDNNSEDGTSEKIKEYSFTKVTLLEANDNLGCSKGRNLGIDFANSNFEYDYMLFLDNDTIVKKDFLDVLINDIEEDESAGLVYPKIFYMDNPEIIQHAGFMKMNYYTGKFISSANGLSDNGEFDNSVYSEICSGTCILLQKELIIKSNGYDPQFDPYGYEDLDFILRATDGEPKIKYCPRSIIYHKESRTPTKGKYNNKFAKLKGRNLKLFMNRHASSFQRFIFHIVSPFSIIKTLVRMKDPKIVLSLLKSYFSKSDK